MLHLALKFARNLTFSSVFSGQVYVSLVDVSQIFNFYIYIYIYKTALDAHVMPNCPKNSINMNLNDSLQVTNDMLQFAGYERDVWMLDTCSEKKENTNWARKCYTLEGKSDAPQFEFHKNV